MAIEHADFDGIERLALVTSITLDTPIIYFTTSVIITINTFITSTR